MKFNIVLVTLVSSHFVSSAPLSGLFDGDLTDLVGDLSIPGLDDAGGSLPLGSTGDILSGLLSEDDTLDSLVGGLLDTNNLGLGLKERDPGFIFPSAGNAHNLAVLDVLLNGGLVADLSSVGSVGHGRSLPSKRQLEHALIKRGLDSIASSLLKRYLLGNDIGGNLGVGLTELVGTIPGIGSGLAVIDGLGASGNIGGSGLTHDLNGQLGTGLITAGGVLDGIGGGALSIGGIGASGHVNRDIGGQFGSGPIAVAGELAHNLGGGLASVSGLGGDGHVGNDIGGSIGSGVIAAAGSIPDVAGGAIVVGGAGGSGHISR